MSNNTITIKINTILLKTTILIFPLITSIFFLFLKKRASFDVWFYFIQEDGLIEYLTCAFYFLSSTLAIFIATDFIKKRHVYWGILYIFLAFGLFFSFGEEISWGQRIIGVKPTEFFLEHSSQQEINIHNLIPIQMIFEYLYILVGFCGSFLWLFTLLKIKKFESIINPYLIPNWYLMGYFLPVAAFYLLYYWVWPDYNSTPNTFFNWSIQEPAELILSIGFFMFVLINRYRQLEEFNLPKLRWLTIRFNRSAINTPH